MKRHVKSFVGLCILILGGSVAAAQRGGKANPKYIDLSPVHAHDHDAPPAPPPASVIPAPDLLTPADIVAKAAEKNKDLKDWIKLQPLSGAPAFTRHWLREGIADQANATDQLLKVMGDIRLVECGQGGFSGADARLTASSIILIEAEIDQALDAAGRPGLIDKILDHTIYAASDEISYQDYSSAHAGATALAVGAGNMLRSEAEVYKELRQAALAANLRLTNQGKTGIDDAVVKNIDFVIQTDKGLLADLSRMTDRDLSSLLKEGSPKFKDLIGQVMTFSVLNLPESQFGMSVCPTEER